MKVCKFGGSSVADAAQIRKMCDIVISDRERRIVVVSAPGKRNGGDRKVTDLLIDCAKARLAGGTAEEEIDRVVTRFADIQTGLGLPDSALEEIRSLISGCVGADTGDMARYTDAVKAAGEDYCARLVALEFVHRGR